jgi:signal transduction histidine kinase
MIMKLLTKTMLYYLVITVPLVIIAGVICYYSVRHEIKESTDDLLYKERSYVLKHLNTLLNGKDFYLSEDGSTLIKATASFTDKLAFSDTVIYDKIEDQEMDHRMMKTYATNNDKNYLITIIRPTFDDEEMVDGLMPGFILILAVLLLSVFVMSQLGTKILWKPFYITINKLKNYSPGGNSIVHFDRSSTLEFDKLNESLNKMTETIRRDFANQKQFTENASHEMQTPVSVIKAKLSLLMQSPRLNEKDMEHIAVIDNTLKRLAGLNNSLLLLSKIENRQFNKPKEIKLSEIAKSECEHYRDFLEVRNISLDLKLKTELVVNLDPELANILVGNLIQNAIRHNYDQGKIEMEIAEKELIIKNTGKPLKINVNDLYLRFKKNEDSMESTGLGLSIVKSICDTCGIKISYEFKDDMHVFKLVFAA